MRFPLLTVLLVLANFAAYYGFELPAGGLPACEAFGLIPRVYSHTGNLAPIFTAMFLHDPENLVHLGGNMAVLLVFGAIVEGELGGLAFLLLYGLAGLAGGLLHCTVDPSSTAPMVGASGAIFGVLAVAGAMRPRLLGFVAAFGALNVWYALTGTGEGVSFGAHIGGLAAGAAFALVLRVAGAEAFSVEAA